MESPATESVDEVALSETLDWIGSHLDQVLSLSDMASHSNMSTRHFSRRFAEVVGTTPHQWLIGQRIARAQALLETTHLSIEHVAQQCGSGSAVAMRPHFAKAVRLSPAQYRQAFCDVAS